MPCTVHTRYPCLVHSIRVDQRLALSARATGLAVAVAVAVCYALQAAKLGAKRSSEQATKRLKDMAAAAISRRERALYEAREAMVR